jgi:hypothetical protein
MGSPKNLSVGGVRNGFMLRWRAQVCLAFPGSNGTADMCRRARAAEVEVIEVK